MELDGSTEASDQAAMAFAVLSVALCCTMWLLTEVNVAKGLTGACVAQSVCRNDLIY